MGEGRRGPDVERRREVRRSAAWRAAYRLITTVVEGVILDITAYGVFFAVADLATQERLARLVTIDRRVALRFDGVPGLEGLELPGYVRWSGYSAAHARYGFGIEFSHRPLI